MAMFTQTLPFLYTKYIYKLIQKHNTADALSSILESAYEGIAVVDEYSIVQEFNEAYKKIPYNIS
ncbi:hypothetical protein [Metabacillus litoralis]|jgi:hypothetical protein|uniref:hypothetical protein n=1 Tax=Metabacillus litoralis TaxID=152268 RepID=UPI00203C3D36|nr:hypothetical protein [Metabacillus litoralis]